jgi:hypothetical protein
MRGFFMSQLIGRFQKTSALILVAVIVLVMPLTCWASITGSISGIITDPQGAVVPNVSVVATCQETKIVTTVATDSRGFYSFPVLAVGTYDIVVAESGFKKYEADGIKINSNSSVRTDISLSLGSAVDTVTVESNALQVETQNTQMGEVIESRKMIEIPLNGRSFIDLLALQPGVAPYQATAFTTGTGIGAKNISGNLSDGQQSMNGGRPGSNGYMVNGASAEEQGHLGAALIPNLDSIAEFRIITNNFNAEYGNYSGGQVNIVTKSGTNAFHGSAFDFLRNTELDAIPYFQTSRGVYRQNQFGGALGAPIIRKKMFGFVDYQGTRQAIGAGVNDIVPSDSDRTGNLLDQLGTGGQWASVGSVNGAFWAQTLSNRLGYTVTKGEPYYKPGCTTSTCVFPGGVIPQKAWSPVAVKELKFIPTQNSNVGVGGKFSTTAYPSTLTDDKGSARVDLNSRWGALFFYYYRDRFNTVNPYGGHINVPGFASGAIGFSQMANAGLTTTIGASLVNDLRLSYLRVAGTNGIPVGGVGTTLSSLGFNTPWGSTGGISPVISKFQAAPYMSFKHYVLGTIRSTIIEANNSVQILDNLIWTHGSHSYQFGINAHYDQVNQTNTASPNGSFSFNGSETGFDFADFLIGAPRTFGQAGNSVIDTDSKYVGVYGQDSWRASSTLTVNYGLRWDIWQPWWDTRNRLATFVVGEQSLVYPGAPKGMVFPGDPGVPRTITPTRWNDLGPRLGLAYSPNSTSGILRKLTGGAGKSSIRAGFGLYFSTIPQVTGINGAGGPPFNVYYSSSTGPVLESPFQNRNDGSINGPVFPAPLPPGNASPAHPDNSIDWSQYYPISGSYGVAPNNVLPYVENYNLSIQRQLGSSTVMTISYIGTAGRHLIAVQEANPGNKALCALLSDPVNVAPGTDTCTNNGEDSEYTTLSGQNVSGTRLFGNVNVSSNGLFKTIGSSHYNSLQASLKQQGKYENFLVGYTWGKSIDDASDEFASLDAYNPSAGHGLSYFDIAHNLVASYSVKLPFEGLLPKDSLARKLIGGWDLAGVSSFVSGQIISLSESDDNSYSGAGSAPFDRPSYSNTGAKLFVSKNPRNRTLPYFNPDYFVNEPLGQVGNAMPIFFHGPGQINTNATLSKDTPITERVRLQFRVEMFNVFNHPQFDGADGEITDSGVGGFGYTNSAYDPRIGQVALKLVF